MKKFLKAAYILPVLVVILCIPAVMPYFHPGYFPTHDGEWAVVRLGDMFRTVKDLQIPPRYSGYLNFGYGYPLFNFAYPFPYYIGLLFVLLKFGLVGSIKLLFVLSVFLSALCMYFASKTFWKNEWSGVISALLYIYIPYRFVDLYVRGSIGESLSFIAFPLLFYLLTKIAENKNTGIFVIAAACVFATLIPTHNIMTVLFTPVLLLFIFCLTVFSKKKHIIPFVWFFIVSVGLSAFFWLPALGEKSNVMLSKIPIADRSLYFVDFAQLIVPRWGYGVPTDPNGFSYQIGIAQILAFLSILVFLVYTKSKKVAADMLYSRIAVIFGFSILVMVFFMFQPSQIIWEKTPLLSEINYPWILLSQIGFVGSFIAGILARQRVFLYIGLTLVGIAFMLTIPYARPSEYVDRGDEYYLTNQGTTTSSDELMPVWVKEKPTEMYKKKIEVGEAGTIERLMFDSNNLQATVNNPSPTTIRIHTIYYPGWKVLVDSTPVTINYNNAMGVMDVEVPQGVRAISATFSETPLRLTADILSVISLIGILGFLFGKKVKVI